MRDTATFAAGCFWGIEATFRRIKGVLDTTVGYAGGSFENPTYDDVCSGKTGHAEVVRVEYDPSVISYDDLLNAFWMSHPAAGAQRPAVGAGYQYRSAIFFHNPEQEVAAIVSKEVLEGRSGRHVLTEIKPAPRFYRAEEYHQRYFELNGPVWRLEQTTVQWPK